MISLIYWFFCKVHIAWFINLLTFWLSKEEQETIIGNLVGHRAEKDKFLHRYVGGLSILVTPFGFHWIILFIGNMHYLGNLVGKSRRLSSVILLGIKKKRTSFYTVMEMVVLSLYTIWFSLDHIIYREYELHYIDNDLVYHDLCMIYLRNLQ